MWRDAVMMPASKQAMLKFMPLSFQVNHITSCCRSPPDHLLACVVGTEFLIYHLFIITSIDRGAQFNFREDHDD